MCRRALARRWQDQQLDSIMLLVFYYCWHAAAGGYSQSRPSRICFSFTDTESVLPSENKETQTAYSERSRHRASRPVSSPHDSTKPLSRHHINPPLDRIHFDGFMLGDVLVQLAMRYWPRGILRSMIGASQRYGPRPGTHPSCCVTSIRSAIAEES